MHEATPRVLALEMSAVPDLEYTALKALTEAEQKLRDAGTTVWLVALNPQVRAVIERSPLGTALGPGRVFPKMRLAVDAYCSPGEVVADGDGVKSAPMVVYAPRLIDTRSDWRRVSALEKVEPTREFFCRSRFCCPATVVRPPV